MRNMSYTTVLQVPSTRESALLKGIASLEPRLARASGYSVRLVEKSGVQAVRLFDRKMEKSTCERPDCLPCSTSSRKSKCKKTNLVYRATCLKCMEIGSLKPGVYIGETSRTLAERSSEHATLYDNLDLKSFMTKHWANEHHELDVPPVYKFEVVKQHRDTMSRQLHEALLIEKEGCLNSKSEFSSNRLARLTVEATPWEEKQAAKEKSLR